MLQSLCQFCSKFLEELEIVINDLETQFQSGVNMVLMMGLLEGYYIPHYLWHYSPKNFEERVRQLGACVGGCQCESVWVSVYEECGREGGRGL